MKKTVLVLLAFILFCSHDMYLKLGSYFLEPNTTASINLFNGTFENSDNVIDRNRMIDVSLVGNGVRTQVDTNQWYEEGQTTILNFKTGQAGTWVAGVSTRPRNIEMAAKDFNGYLEHDGVLDMLEARKKNNTLDQDAVEKYSKHVKTIFQVGDRLSDDWKTKLGYPIEFIPLSNPYDLHPGHDLEVQLLWKGQPLANQLVYVGSKVKEHAHADDEEHTHADGTTHSHADADEHTHADGTAHSHADDEEHTHANGTTHSHADADEHTHADEALKKYRTDAEGKLVVNIDYQGIWYLRTIHLVESEEPGLTHESNWATLTFEVGEGHSHEHHEHSHEEASLGIPSYVYWIGSLLLVGILFFVFNRKNQ